MARWIQNPDIIEYIIDAYAGVQKQEKKPSRRTFIWSHNEERMQGNVEAFAEHLIERFDLLAARRGVVTAICNLMVEWGDRMKPATPKVQTGAHIGAFREPELDQWVIGMEVV